MVDAMSREELLAGAAGGQDTDAGKSKDRDAHAQQLIGHKLYPEWQKKFASEIQKKKGA